jgi:hypothetical protein
VLVQQVACAFGAQLIADAFGFGSTEPRTVDVGLFRRLLARHAFLKSIQIDDFPHARLHHETNRREAKISEGRICCAKNNFEEYALTNSIAITGNPLCGARAKNVSRSVKNKKVVLHQDRTQRCYLIDLNI